MFGIVKRIVDAKAQFRSLAEPWADSISSTGRLMLAVLGGLADVERDLIRTRTAEGRSRAKVRGTHMGRPPSLTPSQKKEAIRRRAQGATLTATTSAARRFHGSEADDAAPCAPHEQPFTPTIMREIRAFRYLLAYMPPTKFRECSAEGNALMPRSSENGGEGEAREDERMASIPATYADGFTISWGSGGIRLSFCEYVNRDRYYRVAVFMQLDAAEDLAKVLSDSVEKAKAETKNGNAG